MDSFGELNFVNVTIEKNKELKLSEDGKMQKRYQRILNFLDPEKKYELNCAGGFLRKDDNKIALIRTYKSKTGATGFSLEDEKICNYPAFCVVFKFENENIERIYYIEKGTQINRGGGSQIDVSEKISEKKLEELCNTDGNCIIISENDSYDYLQDMIDNSISEE